MPHLEHINWLAVIVAAVLNMVIGGLWYSPMLFGKMWMQLSGFSEADKEKAAQSGMAKMYIMQFIFTLLFATFLGHFQAASIGEAITWGIVLWIGVVLPVTIGDYLWMKRSMKLYMINIAQFLVIIIVDNILFASWH